MNETPCSKCPRKTRRKDGLCPNCASISLQYDLKTTAIEEQRIIERGQKCTDCGFGDLLALKLYFQNGGTTGGVPAPINAYKALQFCSRADAHPDEYLVRCLTCQGRFHTSSGRPPKYATFEERQAARKRQRGDFKEKQREKAIAYYETDGQCVACDAPADGLHWIGEPGNAPKEMKLGKQMRRQRPWVYSQVLANPEFARQYAPYCDAHRPATYLERAQRGEVAAPPHWAR